jgi:CheY-like chemotaxis protein
MAHILVVDDDPTLRRAIALTLEKAGHSVLRYENGRKAVDYLEHGDADLLITDVLMPEMDGLETVRAARRLQPQLPILAISGGLPEPTDYLGITSVFGATAVLQKPFSSAELITMVENLLSRRAR